MYDYFKQETVVPEVPEETKPIEEPKESKYPWRRPSKTEV